ncbi:MAG: SDR family NAD(P)-dependent oxidoreductase, partial [Gammaproteobacteria bacterium]|nr:SDR family NAD(P)-dependent oxidoreductase [Gammaproteobacteria bacterium]
MAAKVCAEYHCEHNSLFITVNFGDGSFNLSSPKQSAAWQAGLAGLSKTIGREWPNTISKTIDLNVSNKTVTELAKTLFNEINIQDTETEIGLPDKIHRLGLRLTNTDAKPKKIALKKNSVILASGGARGITALCLIELAKQNNYRFILLGRTALNSSLEPGLLAINETQQLRAELIKRAKQAGEKPSAVAKQLRQIQAAQAIQATINALQQLGSSAEYYAADICDTENLNQLYHQLKTQYSKIDAIVHGAGVLADRLIKQKTVEQFQRVFNTKVLGLYNLLHIFKSEPLKFLGLFSSVAGRYGNQGQCDYAMANEVLNKVGQYWQAQHPNCL